MVQSEGGAPPPEGQRQSSILHTHVYLLLPKVCSLPGIMSMASRAHDGGAVRLPKPFLAISTVCTFHIHDPWYKPGASPSTHKPHVTAATCMYIRAHGHSIFVHKKICCCSSHPTIPDLLLPSSTAII